MNLITIKFPFKAISKDNEKVFNRQGRPFLSAKYKKFAELVRLIAVSQYKGKPLEGNLWVEMCFNFKNKVRCDLSNLPKGILDACNGLLWKDDKQITGMQISLTENAKEESFMLGVDKNE